MFSKLLIMLVEGLKLPVILLFIYVFFKQFFEDLIALKFTRTAHYRVCYHVFP